jgi:ATP-dependent DNA helicase RecG
LRPNNLNIFFTPLTYIKGVGPKISVILSKLLNKNRSGKEAVVKDFLFHLPYNLITRKIDPAIHETGKADEVIFNLKVNKINTINASRRKIIRIECDSKIGLISLVYFNLNKKYLEANFKEGSKIRVAGRLEKFNNQLQIVHPSYVVKGSSQPDIPLVEPVYPLTQGLSNKLMIKISDEIFNKLKEIEEWQNPDFKKQNHWQSFTRSLYHLHHPENFGDFKRDSSYLTRLSYDELLANQLAIAISREKIIKQNGFSIKSEKTLGKKFADSLPFKLTDGQRQLLKDIFKDMASKHRMFRLVQGDVGSGKTVVAAFAMLNAVEAGFQTAFMAPTEILARQQLEWFREIIEKSGLGDYLKPVLLAGSLKKPEKEKIQEKIKDGIYNIIVGTHALFQEKVNFKNLGFIVIDEQHRFGVKQRMELALKGDDVDVLLMTATPIPRTMAMTLYGDMDVSSLYEKPAGRQEIETKTIPKKRLDEVIDRLHTAIEKDDRIYWVCPLVAPLEEEEIDDYRNQEEKIISAEERFSQLKKIFGNKAAICHGQMKQPDKEKAVSDFAAGKVKILVATTVIEVGVNVPEATIMIIENAEKFGLSQLHQLRGRVGRGSKKSSCILLYSNKISENGKSRLKVLRDSNDGFKIAEEDMILRGTGDILGTKQSGMPDFSFAELPEDKELLMAARDDVKIIMEKDRNLNGERGKALRKLLYLFEYDRLIENINA